MNRATGAPAALIDRHDRGKGVPCSHPARFLLFEPDGSMSLGTPPLNCSRFQTSDYTRTVLWAALLQAQANMMWCSMLRWSPGLPPDEAQNESGGIFAVAFWD